MTSNVSVGIGKVKHHVKTAQSRMHIRGGRIVNDDQIFDADLYVEDGKIKEVGQNLVVPGGVRTINASGRLVMPGGIDTSVYFKCSDGDVTSPETYYTGTRAALYGGTSTVFEHVVAKSGESLLQAYERVRKEMDAEACCDYALHVCVSKWNDTVAAEIETLVKDKGVLSFEVSSCGDALTDDQLDELLRKVRSLGGVLRVRCENARLIASRAKELVQQGINGPEGVLYARPDELETDATRRTILLAELAAAPCCIAPTMNVATARVVAKARRRAALAYAETTASAISIERDVLLSRRMDRALSATCAPPIRNDRAQREALIGLLANGDISSIASDHRAYSESQKLRGRDDFRNIPLGVSGVEERLAALWTYGVSRGLLSATQFVAAMSTNAAKFFGVYPRKGRIAAGADADVVIWDPAAVRRVSSRTQKCAPDVLNVFEGVQLMGSPVLVVTNGRVVIDELNLAGAEFGEPVKMAQGAGRFLSLRPFVQYVYARVDALVRASKPSRVDRAGNPDAADNAADALHAITIAPTTTLVADASPVTSATNGQNEAAVVEKKVDLSASLNASMNAGATAEDDRPATAGRGGRKQHESSFSLSGSQTDDNKSYRPTIRMKHPPGGSSSGNLW